MTGPQFILPDWPAPANVRALQTTREGGVSAAAYGGLNLAQHVGDDPAAVSANREQLHSACLPAEPRWLNQVHGPVSVHANTVTESVDADAAWTMTADVVCAVLTADCLPVLFCDRDGRQVAAAHAGWRGLCSGVLELTVDRFLAADIDAGDLLVWLGPAIGPTAYEVDVPVFDAFVAGEPECRKAFRESRPGHWHLDLYAVARTILARIGVTAVFGGDFCTCSEARFFSHRREAPCGRQASLIWLAD